MSRLQLPARKLLLEQVKTAAPAETQAAGGDVQTWNVQLQDKQLSFGILWVQGTVTRVCYTVDHQMGRGAFRIVLHSKKSLAHKYCTGHTCNPLLLIQYPLFGNLQCI